MNIKIKFKLKILLFLFLVSAMVLTIVFYKCTYPKNISVIMSTYNRAELLPRAIDSILNQTYTDFEFIIINDGSTDNTDEILKQYTSKDSRIKVIKHEKNKGLVAGLNEGLKIAKGKYIARMDDDDISYPKRFELQLKFLKNNPDITVCGTGPSSTFPSQEISELYFTESVEETALRSFYGVVIFHPSAMIRSDFLRKNNIRYQSKYISAEDTDFWHQIVVSGGKIANVAPSLVKQGSSKKKEGYYKEQFYSYLRYINDSLSAIRGDYIFKHWVLKNQKDICFILDNIHKDKLYGKAFNKKTVQTYKEKYGCLRQAKILACLSSFKRPIFVSGQILRLMNQTYPVDVSVSVKGVSEDFVKKVLQPEWKKFIQNGRVKLRIDQNRDQFANFLDTVRDIDLEEYDLFCKVDDDDFYGPDYFLNLVHSTDPALNYGISFTRNAYTISDGDDQVVTKAHTGYWFGPMMCFPRKIIQLFLEIEKHPKLLEKYSLEHDFSWYRHKHEDALFHHLSRKVAGEEVRNTPKEDVAIGRQYLSVTRGNYL